MNRGHSLKSCLRKDEYEYNVLTRGDGRHSLNKCLRKEEYKYDRLTRGYGGRGSTRKGMKMSNFRVFAQSV